MWVPVTPASLVRLSTPPRLKEGGGGVSHVVSWPVSFTFGYGKFYFSNIVGAPAATSSLLAQARLRCFCRRSSSFSKTRSPFVRAIRPILFLSFISRKERGLIPIARVACYLNSHINRIPSTTRSISTTLYDYQTSHQSHEGLEDERHPQISLFSTILRLADPGTSHWADQRTSIERASYPNRGATPVTT